MFKPENTLSPEVGRILLSEPFLFDPNFTKSVVLLCEHTDESSLGFILNQPTDFLLNEVIDLITELKLPLYTGGPVENNTLHFLHRDNDITHTSAEIVEGIYWSGDFELVKEKLESNTLIADDYMFFLGYSGWGKNQLQKEIEEGSWVVTDTNVQTVFNHNEIQWKNLLEQMGGIYKLMANAPANPHLN